MIAACGLAVGVQQRVDVERHPRVQLANAGDAMRPLSLIARAEAVLLGEERVEVDDTELAQRRLLHLRDQRSRGRGRRCSSTHWRRGSTTRCARGPTADHFRRRPDSADVETRPSISSWSSSSSMSAAGRRRSPTMSSGDAAVRSRGVDGEVRALVEGTYAIAVMSHAAWPSRHCLRDLRARARRASGLPSSTSDSSTYGTKISGFGRGTPAGGCPCRPWGRDRRRDALQQALLEQHDAESGLARAGHADDHAVRRELRRRVEHRRRRAASWSAGSISAPRNSFPAGTSTMRGGGERV